MYITDTHTVTLDEAAYEVTKALLPFLIEAGTAVAIRRDGWLLMVEKYVFKLLEEMLQPLEYSSGGCKISVVKNGRTAYSRRSTPPNGFEGVAWAMETLEFTGGGTVWKRAIVSEDDVHLVTVKRRSTRK